MATRTWCLEHCDVLLDAACEKSEPWSGLCLDFCFLFFRAKGSFQAVLDINKQCEHCGESWASLRTGSSGTQLCSGPLFAFLGCLFSFLGDLSSLAVPTAILAQTQAMPPLSCGPLYTEGGWDLKGPDREPQK